MNAAFSPSGKFLFLTVSQVGIWEGGIAVLPGISTRYEAQRVSALRHVAHFPMRSPQPWRHSAKAEAAAKNNRAHENVRQGVVRVKKAS